MFYTALILSRMCIL